MGQNKGQENFHDSPVEVTLESRGQFAPDEMADGHFVIVEGLAPDRPGSPFLSHGEVETDGVDVELGILGAAGSVLEHRETEPGLLPDLPSGSPPGKASKVLHHRECGPDGFLERPFDGPTYVFGCQRPADAD